MERNVGALDRNVRLIVGIALGAIGLAIFAGPLSNLGTVVGAIALLVGVVMLGTGLTQQCLLYQLIGLDTSK
ncbi:hypothetical protein HLRTI_001099 [Halorhabdus tiamatea SARL4B]|uniref:Inner membrane protein YgaP-like transmembrane domain-containing protein n=1 Tax=Halorhabdus tiamatea SARL4B TaxID=1033806 RepID=F7PJ56_9EURY|nr:DUF2892 domain-containing protein [Halorhabdus tiamatea]ERJ06840.1 hypothetical protein HLRTI_001099 [Halorhabdus tiamatea SARL4B]CCQ33023.1 hypothetical protein (DUF2892) [Halorhabdus tiamatea SARL4B]